MARQEFSRLHSDALIAVIVQVKTTSANYQDLFACLLVNRQWCAATAPILYGNIALTDRSLANFASQLNLAACGQRINSITLSLGSNEPVATAGQLVPLLSHMSNLRSCSLRFTSWEKLPQNILVDLIEALPDSCTSLELDTLGEDFRGPGLKGHVCEALRKVLPRMRHVRVRACLCEQLFVDPVNPLSLPNMRTLVVNCSKPPGLVLPRCDHRKNFESERLVWRAIKSGFETIVDTDPHISKDAKMYMFVCTDRDDNDFTLYQAYICADMVAKESRALPYFSVWMESAIRGSWLVRTSNGDELMSTSLNIEAIAEGKLWRDTTDGARLPAEILEDERLGRSSFATGCVERPMEVRTAQQWREDNPRKSCELWQSEKKAGVKLLEAERRTGRDAYLSLEQLQEATPPGWKRVRENNNVLEKDEQ
ncbi:hypothetical protein BKA63DRAFT_177750 [Paraphoma chrysanthemicola]|nr:hypothetical protein BKA63DRAFT_177750 [Paraphoma chrysanthemicola]